MQHRSNIGCLRTKQLIGQSEHITLTKATFRLPNIMSLIKDDFLPSEAHNSLPYIIDNENVPHDNNQDITDLVSLFRKHQVPQGFCVKLVYKHFDTEGDEVMVSLQRALQITMKRALGIIRTLLHIQKVISYLFVFPNRNWTLQRHYSSNSRCCLDYGPNDT